MCTQSLAFMNATSAKCRNDIVDNNELYDYLLSRNPLWTVTMTEDHFNHSFSRSD